MQMNRRTLCIALIAGSVVGRASAQDCDRLRPCPGPLDAGTERQYATIYGSIDDGPFPVPAGRLSHIDPSFLRQTVNYPAGPAPGAIVIDPHRHFLYLLQ